MEFPCPSCHKVTRVGKKGVSLLPDNFYVPLNTTRKTQQDEVYLSDDDDNDNGDGYDDSTAKTVDAAKSRLVLCKFLCFISNVIERSSLVGCMTVCH